MATIQQKQAIEIGDKVIFDKNKIEVFKAETSGTDKAIRQYQQIVLGGVDQTGIAQGHIGNLTTVSYPDGWDVPVPTKYLIVLPQEL